MLRWACLVIMLLIVAVSVIEYVWHVTPLEILQGNFEAVTRDPNVTVIRVGVASWQMNEFPWEETIRRFEADCATVRIRLDKIPEGSFNSLLLFWASGYTEFDVIVAFADEEIHPFIDYNWSTDDPARRSLLVNVADYLTPEQMESFVPAFLDGCSRMDPNTGKRNTYEIPWMGEVLALNYNKKFFELRGIERPPQTWAEVEEDCRKLKGLMYKPDKDRDPYEIAPITMNFDQKGFFAQNCYIPMLAAFKKGRGIQDEEGRLDVSSPEAVKVFETLKRWWDEGLISRGAFVSATAEQELRTLHAAMYPHWQSRGLWAVADHGADMIGIAATPGAQEAGSLIATYGCIIPKCSPVKEKAVEVCYKVFSTDEYGFQSAVAKGFILDGKPKGGKKMPVIREIYSDPTLPAGIVELEKGLRGGYSYPDPSNWKMVAEILVVEFQRYVSDKHPSAEAALAQVRRRLAEEVYKD